MKHIRPHRFALMIPREPVDLWEKLQTLAADNRRRIAEEVLIGIEERLMASRRLSDKELEILDKHRRGER